MNVIRRAEAADVPALARTMKQVTAEERWLATNPSVPEAELARRIAAAVGDEACAVLALERGGGVAGAIVLRPVGPPRVLMIAMWIVAAHRGGGGGRALLESGIAAARELGARKLVLEAFTGNDKAIAMYERAGFEHEGLLRDHYLRDDGSVRSVVVMGLLLGAGQ